MRRAAADSAQQRQFTAMNTCFHASTNCRTACAQVCPSAGSVPSNQPSWRPGRFAEEDPWPR